MNICHVITRMIVGGAQENTLFSVKGHLEHGHDVTLLIGRTVGPEGNLLDKVTVPGLNLQTNSHLRREINPYHDLRAYVSIRDYFRAQQFDVVHTHSSKAGVIARRAAVKAGVPVVVHTVHGPSFHSHQSWFRNRFYIYLERLAASYSLRNYAVADAMTTLYLANKIGTSSSFKTVYSGMDLEPYLTAAPDPELAAEIGLKLDRPVIGKIARLFELKGYEYLLQAAPRIADAIPDVQFLIIGDGSMSGEIKAEVASLGLADQFVFTGLVEPAMIHRYVALMDILVHLSVREGLPRSVIQGLAVGKPAVGFDLDGTPEAIIDGKTGILCAPEDSDAVAAAVIKLLESPDLAREMGRNGREHVRHKWDWRRMVDELETDYEMLLSHQRAG